MATPAQCIANAANAQHSTGPLTQAGKAKTAGNSVRHGLFTAFEHLAAADSARIGQIVEQLNAPIAEITAAHEEVIRQYAIAKWRSERYYAMEAAFFVSALADEREKPESAALVEKYGEDVLLGHALRHDAAGPNTLTKLMRYESRIKKELALAKAAYDQLPQQEAPLEKAKPIASPQTSRNAPCPCGSGQKFKRCCGEHSPALLVTPTQ